VGADARLDELGIELPPVPPSAGNYIPARRAGDLLFLSGAGPLGPEGPMLGKVGAEVDLEQAQQAARLTGLNLLAAMRHELGSLDRVTAVIKLLGMVNCAPGFDNTPAVINGCSDLFVEVLGEEIGRHARSAVGMAELPFGIPVEIEAIVQVRD